MKPAADVGGDYYDVININNKDWIVIGDVSGHGISAGLVMMMVQTCIHNTLELTSELSPSQLLNIINKTISKNIKKINEKKYMTIIAFTHEKGKFTFSGLHLDIMIYRQKTKTIDLLVTNGVWIGLTEDIEDALEDNSFELNKGDVMLLHTDGITDAWRKGTVEGSRDIKNDMFGTARLTEIFKKYEGGNPGDIRNNILKELENYDVNDDTTIMIIKKL